MEFTFNVNDILKHEITKISSNFIPPEFSGDRRKLWDVQSKLTDVINSMGEASAAAQGLTKPITTADRLKNSDHSLYLLVDPKGKKGNGSVMGLLKVGRKGLYVFDREGHHHQLQPLCILDFYVHEAMQRMGLGKKIFEHMLKEENVEPVKLAIDRPSDKFLAFLNKHYGLNGPIPQMNNFVVFEGFFLPENLPSAGDNKANNNHSGAATNVTPTKSQNGFHTSTFGRYAAPRPPCSMGQIIHNHSPTVQPTEPNSDLQTDAIIHNSPKLERPRSLSLHTADEVEQKTEEKILIEAAEDIIEKVNANAEKLSAELEKLDIDQDVVRKSDATKTKVHISERANNIIPPDNSAGYTPRTPSNLTEQGFLDLKFYHSRLW